MLVSHITEYLGADAPTLMALAFARLRRRLWHEAPALGSRSLGCRHGQRRHTGDLKQDCTSSRGPRSEFIELAGIGTTLRNDGLVRLLRTTPLIRKLDLEDACYIMDAVLEALTPVNAEGSTSKTAEKSPRPGQALEHMTVSTAVNLTNHAFKVLIRGCPRLRVLQADNTSISGSVLKEFVRLACERSMHDAEQVIVDCQSIGKISVEGVVDNMRPRKGWRSCEARKLGYLDGRDEEELKVGQDECDEKRVVIKSFYSWQIVDEVREWRASKKTNSMDEQLSELEDVGRELLGRSRWWALGPWR